MIQCLLVTAVAHCDVLREGGDEVELVYGLLVDGAHAVEDEVAGD